MELADYNDKVIRGRHVMEQSTVAIAGICRDIEDHLPLNVFRVEMLGEMFKDYRVYLYENDSEDGTVKILQRWKDSNERVDFVSESLGTRRHTNERNSNRMFKLAECRNKNLEMIDYHFDYIILIDLDLSGGWSYEGICNSFGYEGWDFIGSNGLLYGTVDENNNITEEGDPTTVGFGKVYYDTWAYREIGHTGVMDSEEIGHKDFKRGEPMKRMVCCFGGLGIYPYNVAKCGAKYDGPDCEHLHFHLDLINRGYSRMYLNPSQITLYSPTDYMVL